MGNIIISTVYVKTISLHLFHCPKQSEQMPFSVASEYPLHQSRAASKLPPATVSVFFPENSILASSASSIYYAFLRQKVQKFKQRYQF